MPTKRFQVWNCSTNRAQGNRQFDTGPDARAFMDTLARRYPSTRFKIQPVIIPDDPALDWRKRERQRFANGDYKKLRPDLQKLCPKDHFAHVALKKPDAVAFTRDAANGLKDLQTTRAVRSYIDEFIPNLSDAERQRLAAEHIAEFAAEALKWAITADEIVRAYVNHAEDEAEGGPSYVSTSCMRFKPRDFLDTDGVHPVSVYGDSDLRLAYLTDEDGETIARTLVFEKEKVYTRVYGAPGAASSLHHYLNLTGYRRSSYFNSGYKSFKGARIHSIENKNDEYGGYIMPYLDEVGRVSRHDDDWFVIDHGDYPAQSTDGWITADRVATRSCDRCNSSVQRDTLNYVYSDLARTVLRQWCETCYETASFFCHGYHERFDADAVPSVDVDGHLYSVRYAEDRFSICEGTGQRTTQRMHVVYLDEQGTRHSMWSESYAIDNAFYRLGRLYSRDSADPNSLRPARLGLFWTGDFRSQAEAA